MNQKNSSSQVRNIVCIKTSIYCLNPPAIPGVTIYKIGLKHYLPPNPVIVNVVIIVIKTDAQTARAISSIYTLHDFVSDETIFY